MAPSTIGFQWVSPSWPLPLRLLLTCWLQITESKWAWQMHFHGMPACHSSIPRSTVSSQHVVDWFICMPWGLNSKDSTASTLSETLIRLLSEHPQVDISCIWADIRQTVLHKIGSRQHHCNSFFEWLIFCHGTHACTCGFVLFADPMLYVRRNLAVVLQKGWKRLVVSKPIWM